MSGDGKYAFLVMNERAQSRAVAGAALRERISVHRRDQRPHQGRRHAGSPAARDPQPRNRREGSGPDSRASASRWRFRSLRRATSRVRRRSRNRRAQARRALGIADAVAGWPHRGGVGARRRQHRAVAGDNRSGKPASTKVLDRIKDDAWVRDGGQGWLPDNKRVWFLAEHDGWMHLYTVARHNGPAQAVDVREVRDRFASSSRLMAARSTSSPTKRIPASAICMR